MHLRKVKFEATECFYKPYQGPFENELGVEFRKIMDEVQNHSTAFRSFNRKGSKYFGIYYDDPDLFKDHSKLRADIGFLFTTKPLLETEKSLLLKEFGEKGYTYAKFEETECLHDVFPFKWPKFLAFVLGAKKYYSQLRALMKSDPSILKGVNEAPGFMAFETYSPDEIGFYFPLNNAAQFYVTKLDPPKEKSD